VIRGKRADPAADLRLRELDPSADERWERYVRAHPGGLVYHTSAWLRVLQRENGQRPVGLVVENAGGELEGVLPLMATKGVPLLRGGTLSGRRLSSLPRTPVAGPLAEHERGVALLVAGAVERTPPGARLQLKPPTATLDGLVDGVVGLPWHVTYTVELPDRPEDLRFGDARNHNRIRNRVKKSTKLGVVVRHAEDFDDVRAWYPLYVDTMREHVAAPRPLKLFRAMWEELRPRGTMRLLLAERDGRLLAGSVLLTGGSTMFYAFNGAVRSTLHLRPNDLLQWHAIHHACEEGYRTYDLGEVPEGDEGLAGFKSKWGSDARRLRRYHYPPPRPAAPGGERRAGPIALLECGWRRVPLPATRLAGRLIYRYL
jgi:hypothetical protein